MRKDPPIDAIRAVRHRISARFGHNTKALIEHYQELEKRHAGRMLREIIPAPILPPMPPARPPRKRKGKAAP